MIKDIECFVVVLVKHYIYMVNDIDRLAMKNVTLEIKSLLSYLFWSHSSFIHSFIYFMLPTPLTRSLSKL